MKVLESSIEKGLYLLLVFVFLIVGLYSVSVYQNTARTHDILVNNCRVGNEFRTNELNLWNYVIQLSPPTTQSAEKEKQLADFQQFLGKTFALRDCSNI